MTRNGVDRGIKSCLGTHLLGSIEMSLPESTKRSTIFPDRWPDIKYLFPLFPRVALTCFTSRFEEFSSEKAGVYDANGVMGVDGKAEVTFT